MSHRDPKFKNYRILKDVDLDSLVSKVDLYIKEGYSLGEFKVFITP